MDVPKGTPLGFLHDHTDSLVITFKIPLHCPEHTGFGSDGIQLLRNFPQLLAQIIPALGTAALAQGISCDGIVGSGHIVPGSAQFLTAPIQIGLGLMVTGRTCGQVAAQLFQPLPAGFQRW